MTSDRCRSGGRSACAADSVYLTTVLQPFSDRGARR